MSLFFLLAIPKIKSNNSINLNIKWMFSVLNITAFNQITSTENGMTIKSLMWTILELKCHKVPKPAIFIFKVEHDKPVTTQDKQMEE